MLLAYTSLSPDDLALLHEVVRRHRPELVPLLDALGHTPLSLAQRSQLCMALSCEWWLHGRQLSEPPRYHTQLLRLMRCVGMRAAFDSDDAALLREVVGKYFPELVVPFDGSGRLLLSDEQRQYAREALLQERKQDAYWGKQPQHEDPTPLAARLATLEGYVWACSPLLPEDMALLREVVQTHKPALLPLLDTLGLVPLTQEQRTELQSGAVLSEFLANLDSGSNPNERGKHVDVFLDYLRWI